MKKVASQRDLLRLSVTRYILIPFANAISDSGFEPVSLECTQGGLEKRSMNLGYVAPETGVGIFKIH